MLQTEIPLSIRIWGFFVFFGDDPIGFVFLVRRRKALCFASGGTRDFRGKHPFQTRAAWTSKVSKTFLGILRGWSNRETRRFDRPCFLSNRR
jgi:hypothetical protein